MLYEVFTFGKTTYQKELCDISKLKFNFIGIVDRSIDVHEN